MSLISPPHEPDPYVPVGHDYAPAAAFDMPTTKAVPGDQELEDLLQKFESVPYEDLSATLPLTPEESSARRNTELPPGAREPVNLGQEFPSLVSTPSQQRIGAGSAAASVTTPIPNAGPGSPTLPLQSSEVPQESSLTSAATYAVPRNLSLDLQLSDSDGDVLDLSPGSPIRNSPARAKYPRFRHGSSTPPGPHRFIPRGGPFHAKRPPKITCRASVGGRSRDTHQPPPKEPSAKLAARLAPHSRLHWSISTEVD